MDNKTKFLLFIAIIVASIIIGGFIYMSQLNKQESIERQQEMELKHQMTIEEERAKKEKLDDIFNNEIKCQALLKDLKERWSNVVGIYYSEYRNTCIVKYKKNGKVEESPIENMQDSD